MPIIMSCARSVVSSLSYGETTCQLDERAQPLCQCLPFLGFENGETHVCSTRPEAPTPRSEYSELQNLHRNSAAGLAQEDSQRERTDIIAWLA